MRDTINIELDMPNNLSYVCVCVCVCVCVRVVVIIILASKRCSNRNDTCIRQWLFQHMKIDVISATLLLIGRHFAKESNAPYFHIRRINTFAYTLLRASFNGKV